MPPVIAVVGGGVSGLAAARLLSGAPPASAASRSAPEQAASVVLIESAPRFGGKVLSGELGSHVVDLGPDNFLTRDPAAERLCRMLDLGDELVAPATSSASVLARGRLRPLPAGLVLGVPTDLEALARSGIVSPAGVARAALDLVWPGAPVAPHSVGLDRCGGPEWSAASVLERHLGREVVERLVDPLLGGINAGGTGQLSLAVVAPQIAKAIAGRKSVIQALRATMAPSRSPAGDGDGAGVAAAGTTPLFLGLRGGLGRLIDRLVADLEARGVSLRAGEAAVGLRPTASGYELTTTAGTLEVDGVVLAVPAFVAARLVVDFSPDAGAELGSVPYASVALVSFLWPRSAIRRLPRGSGFLVPRREGRLVTGCTVLSSKWPQCASPGEVLLRASTGRYGDERPESMTDEELTSSVLSELDGLVGIASAPEAARVQRWPRAFPQYLPGHLGRMERARSAIELLPPLELAGASLGGIGIPACITSGERAGLAVLERLLR